MNKAWALLRLASPQLPIGGGDIKRGGVQSRAIPESCPLS